MAGLTVGTARAALGAVRALAGARQPSLMNGGPSPGTFCRQLTSSHRTFHLYSASAFSARRQPQETLVSLSGTRWLPCSSPAGALSTHLAVLNMASPAQRSFSTTASDLLRKTSTLTDRGEEDKPERLSIFKRFKQMYKDYWYVLVPVHLATSAVWFGSFYYASKSGIDVAGILESWGFSETITDKLRNSAAGHIAVAYALYKIATPARYTVTLGGTTYSIQYLSERGYIKPVPSRKEMKDMYDDRRDEFREQSREWHEKYLQRRREWREKFQERRKHGWRKK